MTRNARFAVLLGLAALALAPTAIAATPPPATIVVRDAWMRPAAAGAGGAAYLTVMNRGAVGDVLLGAASPDAARATVHESRRVGSVATMRAVASVPVKAGAAVRFAPGGLHVMVEGLRRGLKPGDRFTLILTFAKAGRVHVRIAVRADAAADPMAGMKM